MERSPVPGFGGDVPLCNKIRPVFSWDAAFWEKISSFDFVPLLYLDLP